jgi:hypothetical protein
MSLRPEISGFSLKELFSLQGAKGREALPELQAKLRFNDPARRKEAHAILQRAIDESDRDAFHQVGRGNPRFTTRPGLMNVAGAADAKESTAIGDTQETEAKNLQNSAVRLLTREGH